MRDPFIESIEKLLLRDLAQLEKELEMYPDESSVWKTTGAISNSAGNLTLHLIGNLRYFIGTQLGKTGYERDRPAEFSSRDVPRATLIESYSRDKNRYPPGTRGSRCFQTAATVS